MQSKNIHLLTSCLCGYYTTSLINFLSFLRSTVSSTKCLANVTQIQMICKREHKGQTELHEHCTTTEKSEGMSQEDMVEWYWKFCSTLRGRIGSEQLAHTRILTFVHRLSCAVEFLPRTLSPDLLPALSSTANEQKITVNNDTKFRTTNSNQYHP